MATNLRTHELPGVEVAWGGAVRTVGPSPGRARRDVRVAAILPRGEAIRNFVYSGALDLVADEAEVSLLSVLPSEEIGGHLKSRYRKVHQLRDIPEGWAVTHLRHVLDAAHGRWLWSQAAQQRWQWRDAEANTPAKRLKRAATKLACYPFAHRAGLEALSRVESAASRRFPATDEYTRLWRELRPSLVFNGSHIHSRMAVQAVHAAQGLGIPTAAFIFSWDNLTSQGRIMPPYDSYLVWNESLRDQLLGIYGSIRPEQVFVTGTPQFDFHFRPEFEWSRDEFCARVGADPARPICLYSTGMANHVLKEEVVVEHLADMLREMTDLGPPQLLVRVYAKDQTGRFDDLKRRRPDILFTPVPWEAAWQTPKFEDSYILSNLLRHTDVGINIASTITLELFMFDKPVINVAYLPGGVKLRPDEFDYTNYYAFEHYRPVVESGALMLARAEGEMPGLLRRALTERHEGGERRRAFIRGMFGDRLRDGCSAQRVARTLLALAEPRAGSR